MISPLSILSPIGSSSSQNWTPQFLTATVVSDVAIDLTWTGGKLGKVYRSVDGVTYTQIGTGTDGYSDSGLTAYTLYYYKVKGEAFSSVVSGTTLYPSVLNDANKFGWFDWEKGMEVSPSKWHNLSNAVGNHATDLIPANVDVPIAVNDGAVVTDVLTLQSADFASPLAQPVFMYYLFKQGAAVSTFLMGDTSGSFDLRTYTDSGGIIHATAGAYSASRPLTANEWHIARVYLNGANSKLIIDGNAPATGNFGTNAMANFFIGWQAQTVKEWIIRKSDIGEADIYAYLLKKKVSNVDSFLQKYYTKTMNDNNQLNVVMAGDSILGRMYDSEILATPGEATGLFPPNMWQQNIPYKVLQKLQYADADVKYYNLQAWTKSGFILRDPILTDGQRMYQSSTLNDYAEISITGASYFKILHYTESIAANQITITFNGSAPSSLELTGGDTFNTLTGTPGSNYYKWANNVWSGLNPNVTYIVRITNTGGGTSSIWGCESWNNKIINVIVSAHGGFTAAHHLGELQGFYGAMYDPDLIIHDLACLNDSYSVHNKGGKSPSSASIVAVADDFIFALSSGIFTHYSGLSLTAGEYAEYDGANWITGSSAVTAIFAAFDTNIGYLDDVKASGVPMISFLPHKMTTEANVPYLAVLKAKLRTKMLSLGLDFIDMDAICVSDGWNLNTDLADGTHLNDISVEYYMNEFNKVLYWKQLLPQKLIVSPDIYTEEMDALTGWLKSGLTMELNNTEFHSGTGSIKLTAAVGADAYISKTVLWSLTDNQSKSFQLWGYAHSAPVSTIRSVEIQCSSSDQFTNYFRIFVPYTFFIQNKWVPIMLGAPQVNPNWFYVGAGAPVWSDIKYIRIKLGGRATYTAIMSFDLLTVGVVNKPATMIMFDDADVSVYNVAFPLLKARGMIATVYIVSDWIGTNGRLTAVQLQELYANGWAICNHSKTHVDLRTLTQQQVYDELESCQIVLDGLGFNGSSKHVAYPSGFYNDTVLAAMTAWGAKTGRDVGRYYNSYDYGWPFLLHGPVLATLALIEGLIDYATSQNQVSPILFHKLVESNPVGSDIIISDFTAYLDYIRLLNLQTLTVDEYYRLYSGSIIVHHK